MSPISPLPHPFHRLPQRRVRSTLAALLDDAVVFARGGNDLLRFEHVVGARLLDVDVLPCLARPDGLQRVPVVRRGDRHDVDVLALEHLAKVGVDRRLSQRPRFEALHLVADVALVHVAERGDLHVFHPGPRAQVAPAPPSQARDANPDGVVRALHAANRCASRHHGGAHQEMTSIHSDSFARGEPNLAAPDGRRADSATVAPSCAQGASRVVGQATSMYRQSLGDQRPSSFSSSTVPPV